MNHGEFAQWLRLEFGWKERMAQHFMTVAEQFGKSEIITDLVSARIPSNICLLPGMNNRNTGPQVK